jgi:hypothetical protein
MSRARRPQAVHTGTARGYRGALRPAGGETAFQVVVEQTDLWVVARKDLTREVAAWVTELRGRLKAYMALDPAFGPSLVPVEVLPGAPEIVRAMARAGAACGVGPMAAVAGTIARMVAERFAQESPDILVENGGDIAMFSTRERTVGILADPAGGARLGVRIPAEDFPCALCASSARIGHSLSLGRAIWPWPGPATQAWPTPRPRRCATTSAPRATCRGWPIWAAASGWTACSPRPGSAWPPGAAWNWAL